MKKILLCLLMALGIGQVKSQIIITGFMADPRNRDADVPGSGTDFGATGTTHLGGFEYVQLKATENIDFSVKNYAVVIGRNGTTTKVTPNGWAEGGGNTFKFNLTEGQVLKDEFFYVGGLEKRIAGYKNNTKSTDISETAPIASNRAKWIRAININGGGDDFGNAPPVTTGLMNTAFSFAIGVFDTRNVLSTTKPIDAVFFTTGPRGAEFFKYNNDNGAGYLVPDNDHYSSNNGQSPYFYQDNNNLHYFVTEDQNQSIASWEANYGWFCKLGGVYNTTSKSWTTPREATYDRLMQAGTSENSHTSIPLSRIETGNGSTVLPISLISFTAKKQNGGILLNWSTASEQDNRQFEIFRSADGKDFSQITVQPGRGTANGTFNYSYQDNKPLAGVNYYQLRQIDFDGKSTDLGIIAVNFGLNPIDLTVTFSSLRQEVNLKVYSDLTTQATVYITDVMGRNLIKKKILLQRGESQIQLPVTLQKGIYIATIQTAETTTSLKFSSN